MIRLYDNKEACCGCTACMNVCPTRSITMEEDEEGFPYPKINPVSCTECNACVKVCPFHPRDHRDAIPKGQEVSAVKHQDSNVRKNSSSGGVFTALSDYVLDRGGIVYGAAFNERYEVIHGKAADKKQRDEMRGSKYVQSKLGTVFEDIRLELGQGKLVLFTGTPCQNDGLKSFFGKEYDNLILCDIACHGVPSPKVWETYKGYLEDRYQQEIRGVNFRCKDRGWRNSSLKVEFDGNTYLRNMQEDPYYIMFFSHLIIRPSCHRCVYASYHRVTDLTLADFWGIENAGKAFDDDTGVSLLLANTEKGKEITERIKPDICLIRSSHKECYQPVFEAPTGSSPRRQVFWKDYLENGGKDIINKYGRLSFTQVAIKKIAVPILKKTGLYKTVEKIYYKR